MLRRVSQEEDGEVLLFSQFKSLRVQVGVDGTSASKLYLNLRASIGQCRSNEIRVQHLRVT